LCERAGRGADELATLKTAVRYEPGHRAAWLTYADRLLAHGGREAEAAWALEHAATSTEDKRERLELWRRLAALTREALGDEARAATYTQRGDRLEEELAEETSLTPSALPGGPLVVPRRRSALGSASPGPAGLAPRAPPPTSDAPHSLARVTHLDDTPSGEVTPRPGDVASGEDPDATRELEVEGLEAESGQHPGADTHSDEAPADDAGEPWSGEIDVPDEAFDETPAPPDDDSEDDGPGAPAPTPPRVPGASRRTQELPVHESAEVLVPAFGPSPSKALSVERAALFEQVRGQPLEPEGYRLLAEHFDTANDPSRSSLMLEIARALEGDPDAAPRRPRLILSSTDRVGLKHPNLRGEVGELLGLVGVALCRLYPTTGRHAGTDMEFHLGAGKGARSAADALLASVRILGLRAPEVHLAQDAGPPFSLVYVREPRMLVGKLAVKRELDAAELRFFAGRALFTQLPELLALRNLRREQFARGLEVITDVARGRVQSAEARVAKEAVSPRAWEHLRALLARVGGQLDYAKLAEGARYSSNRAGLVVCGGIAPAVAALRVKRALPTEMRELVRFAASEHYLQLRGRILPRP
jgi:hypothetical protein